MELEEVSEGAARVLVPKMDLYRRPDGKLEPAWLPVFYNPRAAFNRDVAVVVVSTYLKVFNPRRKLVVEPLSGTGIRGIRFALEVRGLDKVVINDIDAEAYKLMVANIQLNNLQHLVEAFNYDANLLLHLLKSKGEIPFVLDIDPFGSPVPFLDAALRVLPRGSLLAVTATDTAPLTGAHPSSCTRKYGASVFRTPFGKEVAARILTGYIARVAAKYDKAVRPLLTYYVDHYVRGYYVVERGASKASRALKELGVLYYCGSCHNVEWVKEYPLASGAKECSFCGGRASALGPLYLGTLHDAEFVSRVEASLDEVTSIGSPERLSRLIALLKRECDVATPFYYRVDLLSGRARVNMPSPARLVEALRSEGYRASLTHFDPRGVKTEAPLQIVYELLKALKSHHPRS